MVEGESAPVGARPLTGTLRTWNDARGFGFIAPAGGGRELFVHITAFPRDGSRPTVGESLVYELRRGDAGKPEAARVYRQALGRPATHPRAERTRRRPGRGSPMQAVVAIALVAALGFYGHSKYQQRITRSETAVPALPTVGGDKSTPAAVSVRCDGRTHCSQMKSCQEAKFFLENCPGTQMDGDRDGTPCEEQWCTGPFAK